MQSRTVSTILAIWVLSFMFAGQSCSGRRVNEEEQEPAASPASPVASKPTQTEAERLAIRVRELEEEVQRLQAESFSNKTSVRPNPTQGVGLTPEPELAESDPQRGFVVDTATRLFQRAKILQRAGQYGEAIAAFNQFVEEYPDHPLAGSAIYATGWSYLQQREYQLAANTLQRGITSYDRNPRITQTLQALAEAQDALQQPQEAARTRSLLANLFPGSAASRSTPPAAPTAEVAPPTSGDPTQALDAPPVGATAPASGSTN